MARKKNALTEYYVAAIPADELTEPEYLRLAKWISTVNDESEEEVEGMAYYDGDGTPEDEVISVKEGYAFEGTYDADDPAMKFIAGLKRETGEGRKIMFRKVESNGDTLEGRATAKDIKYTGGEASGFEAFSCTITWDAKPKFTPAPVTP